MSGSLFKDRKRRRGPCRGRLPRRSALFISTIFTLLFTSVPSTHAAIKYTVSLSKPEQHLFHVSVEVPNVSGEVKLQMAAWNALYEIRDFSSHVQQVEATVDDKKTEITKLDKLTWLVKGSGTVKVSYATFWDGCRSVSALNSNADHAFINPAMILLYVPDRRGEESIVLLTDLPAEWNVASASLKMFDSMGGARSFTLRTPSYDALGRRSHRSLQVRTIHPPRP